MFKYYYFTYFNYSKGLGSYISKIMKTIVKIPRVA